MTQIETETAPEITRSFTDYRATAAVDQTLERIRVWREQRGTQPPSPAETAVQATGRAVSAAGRDLGAALDSAGTVARNVAEIPLQIPAGVIDGVREVFRASDDIADQLNSLVPLSGVEPGDPSTPGRTIARNIPQPFPDARTPTGQVTRDASRFMFGFWRGMSATGAIGAAGRAGAIAQPFVAGAIADALFTDPTQQRLSDMWRQAGLPENALTDYLASDPADTRAEGRLKSAIEGLLTGGALEIAMVTARAGRAALRARMAASGAPEGERVLEQARQQYGTMEPQRLMAGLGDPSPEAPRFAVRGQVRNDAERRFAERMDRARRDTAPAGDQAGAARAAAGMAADQEPAIFVNFARINEPEDVQAVIREMADRFAPQIDEARRGVVSNEQTQALADQLGMTVEDVVSRRRGPMSAEEATAARTLLNQSAEQLIVTARRAADASSSEADQFAFRRMMAVHYAIQAEVLAARTETARALQAWSIPVGGGGVEAARAVRQAMDASGGVATQQAIARRMVHLADSGAGPAALSRFTRSGALARSFDVIQEAWVNALLSSPTTHMINVTSNAANAFAQVWERAAAQRIGNIIGEPGVVPGEALAMAYGMTTGVMDAFRLAARTYRLGDGGQVAQMLGRTDLPRDAALSSQAWGLVPQSGLGRAVDFIGHHIVRQPSRFMGAEDAFFKSINYRMELHAASLREASQMLGPDGLPIQGPALWREMARIVNDPPEHIRMQAADAALYATFNRETYQGWTSVVRGLLGLRERVPPAVFVIPFIRTPGNILSYTFERTPLAPLVGQWRADIAAGGARRDIALARLATGSAALLAFFDLADRSMMPGPNGEPAPFEISGRGPDDSGERQALERQGWQQYSIRYGDRWYSYNRLDPVGFMLGFASDARDLLRRREIEPQEVDEVNEIMAAAVATVARSAVDKTWMQGVSQLVEALSEPERGFASYINRLAGSAVPAVVSRAEQVMQPERSEPGNPYEAVLARIPGLSASVPLRRDLWGQTVRTDSGLGAAVDAVSPFPASQVRDIPIDREIARLNLNIENISRRTDWNDAPVNLQYWPEVYDAYRRLAGNELRHPAWNMGARDMLSAVVEGRHELSDLYRNLSDGELGGRAQFIHNTIQEYRQLARQAIEQDPQFSAFTDFVRARQEERRNQRMPIRQ